MWAGGAAPELNGVKVLGTPLGHREFVRAHADERLEEEQHFLDKLGRVHDPQCAWLLLTYCAVPGANHFLRVLPPSEVQDYAQRHDDAVWQCFCQVLGVGRLATDRLGRAVASLPARLGGLGMRSAARTAPAADWAAWVDAAPVLASKAPRLSALFQQQAELEAVPAGLVELQAAKRNLDDGGAVDLPSWVDAVQGARAPYPEDVDAGEWKRGWQYHASSARENHFSQRVVAVKTFSPGSSSSQTGRGAGRFLTAVPREAATTLRPLRFQTAVRRRLRLPLPLHVRQCEGRSCRQQMDAYGDHRAACMRSGRVQRRAKPLERVWARVFREAGGRVRERVFLRDMGLPGIDASDSRQIEIFVTGLPLERGLPLAVDATCVSVLHANGEPWEDADVVRGVCLERAESRKEDKYPELVDSSLDRLKTVACEVAGRWSAECCQLVSALAAAKARAEPAYLQLAARIAYESRWWALLSCTLQDAVAASLIDDVVALMDGHDAALPLTTDVLADELARHLVPV